MKTLREMMDLVEAAQIDEADKKVPDLPIDKKGIEKHYGGSVVKMGQAAKNAGFSDSRIRQTGEKFLQGKLKEDEVEESEDPIQKVESLFKDR